MARHEFEVSGQAKVPLLAKLSARYKVDWERRASTYLSEVAQGSGLAPADVEARCHDNPTLTSLVVQGGQRAGEVEDPAYRSRLSAIASAAFLDAALIDETSLLHSQLVGLEPAHLRALECLRSTLGEAKQEVPDEPAQRYTGEYVQDFSLMYQRGFVTQSAVIGTLEGLRAAGMVARIDMRADPDGFITWFDDPEECLWSITSWGRRALDDARLA